MNTVTQREQALLRLTVRVAPYQLTQCQLDSASLHRAACCRTIRHSFKVQAVPQFDFALLRLTVRAAPYQCKNRKTLKIM